LLATYAAGGRLKKRIESESVLLTVDQAIPCGLIVNELVTNCLKHAFPEGRSGTVGVTVRHALDGRVELSVTDDGVGLSRNDDSNPAGSMGLRLVEDLAHQLDGHVSIKSDHGTCVRVMFEEGGT
jgi:two-component sensor histidine kinase